MTKLYLHNNPIKSIFELLGEKEDDITYTMGWILSKSPHFLKEFLSLVINWKESLKYDQVQIRLQQHETEKGKTDIEIELPSYFFLIIEAKKGLGLPSIAQLRQYVSRKSFKDSPALVKSIVVLSECSTDYYNAYFTTRLVDGIKVSPFSWRDIYRCSKKAHKSNSFSEKNLLDEFTKYFERIMTMQNLNSNKVFCVSLSDRTPPKWSISFTDIVYKKHMYFHPIGSGWPSEPPNYIAFRHYGKLRSIHHIESYNVFKDPHQILSEIPNEEWPPHFAYHLGPAFGSSKEVKNGVIHHQGRYWCMLDTLFVCDTIKDAIAETRKRESLQRA